MSTEAEIITHLRSVHGLAPGETYDPDKHHDIPALCFGSLMPEATMVGEGQHLRPEQDLAWAAVPDVSGTTREETK